jgi:hydroxymethylbilane synthase
MKTEGDRIQDRPLDELGGKGLFVRELDAALADGRGEISVHSCKDMPAEDDAALPIVAVSAREDARDALVLPAGGGELDFSKPIGCSNGRRAIGLRAIYPEARLVPMRGNVPTRLARLDAGEYGALVLAAAGLKRLGLDARISRVFSPEELLPAACQGIIAVQARAGEDTSFLRLFHDAAAWVCARTERAFLRELGAGCYSPAAAYATVDGGSVRIRAMFAGDGAARFGERAAGIEDAEDAARGLARALMEGRA